MCRCPGLKVDVNRYHPAESFAKVPLLHGFLAYSPAASFIIATITCSTSCATGSNSLFPNRPSMAVGLSVESLV